MNNDENNGYLSKSKQNLYQHCPHAYKQHYILKKQGRENIYYKIGIDVHQFIDQVFDTVKTEANGTLFGISKLPLNQNLDYRKNILLFEMMRWKEIHRNGLDQTFFFPVLKEKKLVDNQLKLVGIPDRVHKCCIGDPLAPDKNEVARQFHEFEDGSFVLCENKTGKPTQEKCLMYDYELYWYKLLLERQRPELGPIIWGAIYFPYNNFVYKTKLEEFIMKDFLEELDLFRRRLENSIKNDDWPAKSSDETCGWCEFKDVCEHSFYKNGG